MGSETHLYSAFYILTLLIRLGGEILIRTFKLTNSLGEKLSLNNLDLFAYNPEGLGVSFQNEYIGVNANFIPSLSTINMNTLSLRILFGAISEERYQQFYKFTNFLNYQPLALEYETDAGQFQRLCKLNELTKTEINEWNVIDESMVLEFITPWFKHVENTRNEYDDQQNDGKIYRQAISGDPPEETNLFLDPEIDTIGTDTTNDWYTTGNQYAWSIVTNNQFESGYNIAIINQNEILTGNASAASQNLYAKVDPSSQILNRIYLLDFYFKSDRITEAGSDLLITALNSAGDAIRVYDISDNYGSILDNSAIYYLSPNMSGEWLNIKIAYKPRSNDEIIDKIRFNCQRDDSIFNYITVPKLIQTESIPIENTDAYYIYDYVYEEADVAVNVNYYNIVNDSVYMGSSVGSPIEITIEAIGEPVTNPSWELWQGNKVIQSDRYLLTIPQGYKLVVSSFTEDQYARLVAPDNTFTNVYQSQDLTKTNFINIPIGASTLIFNVGSGKEHWRMREERVVV